MIDGRPWPSHGRLFLCLLYFWVASLRCEKIRVSDPEVWVDKTSSGYRGVLFHPLITNLKPERWENPNPVFGGDGDVFSVACGCVRQGFAVCGAVFIAFYIVLVVGV